jgi:hypothetical protein
MGASVKQLDSSGRYAEADALLGSYEARRKAYAAHPFANLLAGVSDASLAESSRDRYRLKARDFGNGHRELVICKETPDPSKRLERAIARDLGPTPSGEPLDPENNRERAVRRAKQQVRHLAKSMIVNSLWTLTYRANVQDRALVLKHLDAFRRRVVGVLGEWRYIAVLEKQERGAYHVHLATHALPVRLTVDGVKVKSWDVMRAIWRSVVGELGGNFDEAKRKRRHGSGDRPIRGAGAIARYIAGYVAKDMHESEANKKRFSHSVGVDIPEAYRALFDADTTSMRELIELAYAFVGQRITGCWFDAERGVFFIESDDTSPAG